jgi:3-isopropylmalate dehydrogenase
MYKIALIGGDGTGPEVVRESVKVLEAIDRKFGLNFRFTELDYNAGRYLRTGEVLSDLELESLKQYDAILLGAIGDPSVKPGILEKGILLKIRFGLDQYINLRPVKLYENVDSPLKYKGPEQIDYVVVRENTGDLYSGNGGVSMKGTSFEVTTQEMIYTRHQVERCVRFAFDYAKKRHKNAPWKGLSDQDVKSGYTGKLTMVGKSNVLTYTYDLWLRVIEEVSLEYPTIKTDYIHVDAACIYMIECPERFDVIVTTNMFGDIITDLAAVTQGGMGISPGANLNPEGVSMFEPIGGTAPDFTGKNQINPMASIGSAQLMLAHFGEDDAAAALESAMKSVLKEMHSMAAGKMGFSTSEIGDKVAAKI